MPLKIRERPPKRFNVVKPRKSFTTERMGMKKTAGSVRPDTLQSLSKRSSQRKPDLGGKSGWKPPSSSDHDHTPPIQSTMNKNYEDYFFKINRGHNNGSVRPHKHISKTIDGSHYFR